jgi:hypothetical protein
MKIRRLILITGSLLAAAVVVCTTLVIHWQRSQPVFKDAPKLAAAVQAFARDRAGRGQPLPASISLRDLVSGGYIATNDVHAFDGMDVTISLAASLAALDADPQSILIHVRMPDGTHIVLLGDGSIQQVSQ